MWATVISTNCPSGPGKILENGLWGKLVPVANLDVLTDTILKILNEKNHPNSFKCASDFKIDIKVEEYIKLMFKD